MREKSGGLQHFMLDLRNRMMLRAVGWDARRLIQQSEISQNASSCRELSRCASGNSACSSAWLALHRYNAGAMLSGHGTILGNVTNNFGIVAPGGTIGTLTVGSFTQGANGKLFIEVSPTAASLLRVTGTATLGGTIQFVYDPGTYSAKTYQVLTASSISGTFASVAGTPPVGVTQSLTQKI